MTESNKSVPSCVCCTRVLRLCLHGDHGFGDPAFDSDGRLYFSEATGAADDGAVFRLNVDYEAEEFVRVPSEGVDLYWAGNFAFDPDDRLYISFGNRVPVSTYSYSTGTSRAAHPFSQPITHFLF